MSKLIDRRTFVLKSSRVVALGTIGAGSSFLSLVNSTTGEKNVFVSYRALRRLKPDVLNWNYLPFRDDLKNGGLVSIYCLEDGLLWARARVSNLETFSIGNIPSHIVQKMNRQAQDIKLSIGYNFNLAQLDSKMLFFSFENVEFLKSKSDLTQLTLRTNPRLQLVSDSEIQSILPNSVIVNLDNYSIHCNGNVLPFSFKNLMAIAPDKNTPIVVKCSDNLGVVSQIALNTLAQHNYQQTFMVL